MLKLMMKEYQEKCWNEPLPSVVEDDDNDEDTEFVLELWHTVSSGFQKAGSL